MELSMLGDIKPVLPELFLCVSAVFMLMAGVFTSERSSVVLSLASVVAMLVTGYMLVMGIEDHPVFFYDMFVTDRFIVFGKLLVLAGGILALMIGNGWLKREEGQRFEFPVLVQFAVLGLMLMISATDMLGLYMGLEMSSLALYVLAAFDRDNLRSTEAGLKYFVLGSLASGMLLFGISLVYGFSGTISFSELARTIQTMIGVGDTQPIVPHGLVVGMILMLVGFCFKISAVPFHMWTPDVYEGAPTPVTAFFAIAPKVAVLFLLMRLLEQPFADFKMYWQQIIIFVSMASMLVGALGALAQTNLKRLLAYSSIGHVGFALVGIASGSAAGMKGVIIYLALYVLMSAGAFGCLLQMKRHGQYAESFDDLAGISRVHPQFAVALSVLMFSMAGIPPLAGFFGKWFVFLAAIESGLYGLAIVGVLSSVVACYYYLKVIKTMYFDEGGEAFDPMNPLTRLTVSVCVVVMLLFVLQPSVLTLPAQFAVEALYSL